MEAGDGQDRKKYKRKGIERRIGKFRKAKGKEKLNTGKMRKSQGRKRRK